MQDVVRVMGKQGFTWGTSPTSVKTLTSRCLTLEANLWVYFIEKRLILTIHDTSISRDRVMVVHCIVQCIPIDVGCIIVTQVYGVFDKPRGQLFFSWLIMGLCANVTLHSDILSMEDELVIQVNGVINSKTLRRLLKDSPHRPKLVKAPKGSSKAKHVHSS